MLHEFSIGLVILAFVVFTWCFCQNKDSFSQEIKYGMYVLGGLLLSSVAVGFVTLNKKQSAQMFSM